MEDTGYICAGKALHVGDIIAEKHTDNLAYWQITQHDDKFWRRKCDSNDEIELNCNLDMYFFITNCMVSQVPDSGLSAHERSNVLIKLTIAALMIYIVLKSFAPLILADIAAIVCAVLTIITLKKHGGYYGKE